MFQQCLNCEENNCLIHLCCVVILCAKQCFHTSSKSSKCAKCAKSLGNFAQARGSPANSYSESEDSGRLNLEVIMVCPSPFLFGYCSFLSPLFCADLRLMMLRRFKRMHAEPEHAFISLLTFCLSFDECNE